MNKLGKIAQIIVILTCAGSLWFASQLGGAKKQLKADNTKLSEDLGAANAQLSQARTQLDQAAMLLQQAQSEIARVNAERQAAQVALGQKTQEADELKAKTAELEQQLQDTKGQLAVARDTLQKIQEVTQAADFQNLEAIREKLAAQSAENKLLSEQLMSMRSENQALKQKLNELTATPPGLRGKVALVQDNWGFMVLDIGQTHLVRPNTEFLVYRDSRLVGKAQIVSVDATTSIAEMVPEYRRGTPRKGDIVIH